MRQLADRFLIILPLVIDRVLQTEFFYALDLFLRRGSPVHFYAENFSNLDSRCPDSACNRMNQHTSAFWLFEYSSFPVREICREEIDWKSSAFFRTPASGNRPEQPSTSGNFFGERSPLRVAHHALAVALASSAELTTRDQRRLRRTRIPAARRHSVSEIQPSRFDSN